MEPPPTHRAANASKARMATLGATCAAEAAAQAACSAAWQSSSGSAVSSRAGTVGSGWSLANGETRHVEK